MRVAFLGMGRMGRLLAAHVLEAGHELTIWNRTPGKADELRERGAREAAGVEDAVQRADVIILMLFGGDSSREVLGRIAGCASEGTLVIDATTTGPDAARKLGAEAAAHGLRYVDAPVAGSLQPAKEGTLTIFAGGSDADFQAARPLLELWGTPDRVRHIGPVGSANSLKVVVNMCLGIAMAGVGEALTLGEALGFDRDVLLNVLETGPFGWSIKQKRAMLESGEFTPTAFSLDLMGKDLALALEAATIEQPLTAASLGVNKVAADSGLGDHDYAAMAATPGSARRR